jgi:hypothetical protein
MSIPLPALVKQHFATIFAGLLPLHSCGTQAEQQQASAVLQGTMLVAAKLSEDERDNLIQRHMVMTQSLTQKVSLLLPCLLYIGNI